MLQLVVSARRVVGFLPLDNEIFLRSDRRICSRRSRGFRRYRRGPRCRQEGLIVEGRSLAMVTREFPLWTGIPSGQLWRLDGWGVVQPIRSVAPMVFEAIKVRIFGLRSPPATNHAPRGGGLQGVGDVYNRYRSTNWLIHPALST